MDSLSILLNLSKDPSLAPQHVEQLRLAIDRFPSRSGTSGVASPDKLTMSMVSLTSESGAKRWNDATFSDPLANSRLYQKSSNDRESARQEFLSFRAKLPGMRLEEDGEGAVTKPPAFRNTHVFEEPQHTFDMLNNLAMQSLVSVPNINDPALDVRAIPDFNGSPLTDPRRLFFTVAANVFAPYSFFSTLELDLPRFYRFLGVVCEASGTVNPYHNMVHAAEVLHCVHCFICNGENSENFSDIELIALLLAAVCIDVGSFGVSNVFLGRINHPVVQIYGTGFAQENAAVSYILHMLTQEDTNFFPTPVDLVDVMSDRIMKLHFQECLSQLFVMSAAHNHTVVQREVREYVVDGVVSSSHVHKLLIGVLHLCRFPHILMTGTENLAGVNRYLTECLRQGLEEARRMLLVSPLCDEASGESEMTNAQRSLIQDVMLPVAEALEAMLPPAWLANLRSNLDMYQAVIAGRRPPLDFKADDDFPRWADFTHPVIVSIRKIVKYAESLDRQASKVAILNATPQRKIHQSIEAASAFSRVDHYYSFLRMFATFLQEGRAFEDFAGNLLFLAHQLDPLYIGQYALETCPGKADVSVETCREIAALIVETEAAPSTSEVIASPSKRSKQTTDPFVLQLLAMFRSMCFANPNSAAVRRTSWRSPATNKLYAPEQYVNPSPPMCL